MSDTLAQDYAAGIVDDMDALEWLQDNWETIEDWNQLEELMKGEDMDPGVIKSARCMVDDCRDSWDDYGGPVSQFFTNDVLDIETIKKNSLGSGISQICAVQALVTFGGPNAWIISTDGEGLDILVNWGGDSVKLYASTPAVSSHLYELGDLYELGAAGVE